MKRALQYADPALERVLVQAIDLNVPWDVVTTFSQIVRESGSPEERRAFEYIAQRLKKFGVPHRFYEPEIFLSLPRHSSVSVNGRTLRAKSPSMSASTGPAGRTGPVVYVPGKFATSSTALFGVEARHDIDVRGKIVLTEGIGLPASVSQFEGRGAIGQININPGQNIHWGTCTTIWGAPDLDSFVRQPKIPVVSLNNPDGVELARLAQSGDLTVTLYTELEQGWKKGTILVAEIPGAVEPDKFALVHGHLDSWDVGVGDNATGNATLLELARLFWQYRDRMRRSLRVAWWSGHSHGRYAGSTWYADQFGVDLYENCVAQVNIDSPGCRDATEYREISWMSETEAFCKKAIKDAVGQPASGGRALQAGDYSFNNIGISSYYMLLSNMPEELIKEKGYYAVGGCGGNIAWHTEDDKLEIADRNILHQDLKVYAVSLSRTLNAPLLPFDVQALAGEFVETLGRYQAAGAGRFDLAPALKEARALRSALGDFYRRAETARGPQLDAFNESILRITRLLIPINYTRDGAFRHDPALPIPPLPDLAPIQELAQLAPESDAARITITHLTRGQNRLRVALRAATQLANTVSAAPSKKVQSIRRRGEK